MSTPETQFQSIIRDLISATGTNNEVISIANDMGVPNHAYVYFVSGMIYANGQMRFRERSRMNEGASDQEFLRLWKENYEDIKNRLINASHH